MHGQAVNADGDLQDLLLDVHAPVGDPSRMRPAIVFAHGGSFTGGSRLSENYQKAADDFARRGFVVVNIDYRLRPGRVTNQGLIVEALTGDSPTIRDAQHDFQAAVRWTRARSTQLGIDSGRIIAAGESAGAIAAWQAGINEHDPGSSGTPGVSSRVAAVLSWWGAAIPLHFDRGVPPAIDLHGLQDTTVPHGFAAQACALTFVWGSTCEQVLYPSAGHAVWSELEEVVELSAGFACRKAIPGCTDTEPPLVRVQQLPAP